ncbi:MAG TPA: hypothetical protein VFV23_14290 [Verrucomicrobiae bacterium]|nr:hypothetical protein [Verrucomicrobiae bacterium]
MPGILNELVTEHGVGKIPEATVGYKISCAAVKGSASIAKQ